MPEPPNARQVAPSGARMVEWRPMWNGYCSGKAVVLASDARGVGMLNTWRCRLCLAICLAGSAAAFGSAYPEADRYFAVRNASHAVQANAALWKDALIEVRGVIRGCARRDDGGTLIIARDAGDTFVVEAQQKLPENIVDISRTVRVLARISADRASFTSLQLVAVTSEYEAASLEYEREKQRARQRLASRQVAPHTARWRSVRQALRRREAIRRGRSRQTLLASRGIEMLSRYAA